MPDLNATIPVRYDSISLKDQRLPNGMMNFTSDQEETIKAFIKQQ